MKVRTVLSILLGFGPAILLACSCMPTSMSFSLMQYDQAELIVEVVVGEQFGEEQPTPAFDLATYRAQVVKAEAEGRVPPPPPPPPPIDRTGKVKAKVESIFKGTFDADEMILKSDLDGASCGWLPRPGTRYILYLGKPDKDKDTKVYWVWSCSRSLNSLYSNFIDEKRMLSLLSKPVEGEFSERQAVELNTGTIDFCPFKGNFKAGKREGKWLVYPPVYSRRDTQDFSQPALILNYRNGQLMDMEDLKKAANSTWFNWIRHWRFCYFGWEMTD